MSVSKTMKDIAPLLDLVGTFAGVPMAGTALSTLTNLGGGEPATKQKTVVANNNAGGVPAWQNILNLASNGPYYVGQFRNNVATPQQFVNPIDTEVNRILSDRRREEMASMGKSNTPQSASTSLQESLVNSLEGGKFTTGDYISTIGSGLSLLGKLGMATKKADVQPYQSINTPITRETINADAALANNNRLYNAESYNLRNQGNPNLRSALLSSMMGAKMSSDATAMDAATRANAAEGARYQQMLMERDRANTAMKLQVDDMNVRNAGQRKTNLISAFADIGNMANFVGNGFNAKEMEGNVLNILKARYGV